MAASWLVEGAAGASLASLLSSVLASTLSAASVAQTAVAVCVRTFLPNTVQLSVKGSGRRGRHLAWSCDVRTGVPGSHLALSELLWCAVASSQV